MKELLEHRIEQWEDIEEYEQELRRLRRKLIDVKTRWSNYSYPESVRHRKPSDLIEFFLGFECECLEIYFPYSRIRITPLEL